MSAKRVFFCVFQKIIVVCCAIFFGFANAFSANLPSGYTELEYIQSTGTQYIDTGYIPTTDLSKIEFKFNVSTDNATIFGVSDRSESRVQMWHYQDRYSSRTFTNTTNNVSSVVLSLNIDITGNLDVTNGKLTINGNSGISTDSDYKTNYSYPMYVFALNNAGATPTRIASGKVYYLKVYENGTLVRDFVPAKNSSGVIGMYDTVSGTFFTNAGTGTFTAGPVVLNPCRNLFDGEYISVSNGAKAENKNPFYVTPGKKYTISWSGSTPVALNLYAYDSNNTLLYSWTSSSGTAPYFSDSHNAWYNGATFTVPENVVRLRFNTFGTISAAQQASWAASLQIEEGDTATAYVPYSAACHNANQIKIATTAYNAARFSPVQTDLDSAVATIREIVTKTINQTAAIASLQADKQTRPEDACPAGKKCLLVEDNNGKPHWYEIIENIYGLPNGYTALEYIETSGSQYIVLPNFPTASNIDITTDVLHTDGTNEQIFLAPASGIQYLYTVSTGWRFWKSGGGAANIASLGGRHSIKIKTTSSGCEYYVDGQKNTDVPASLFTSAEFSGKTFNLGARTVASGGDYYWKGRIYSFYAECDSEECMNLVPAKRNSDGAIGMYDLTNLNPATAFYTNSGTGTFIAGPEM